MPIHEKSQRRLFATVGLGPVLAVLFIVLSGCSRELTPLETAGGGRPNVLFVSIDTLRADRLEIDNYTTPIAPNMRSLASRGISFTRCIASAPETAPSVASLISGRYQKRHGVYYNQRRLPNQIDTLAERLTAAGYETAAFVGNRLLGEDFGFLQGFATRESFWPPLGLGAADPQGAQMFGDWLRTQPDRPWFAWVHFMDPHGPYNSASKWWSESLEPNTPPDVESPEELSPPISESNFGLGIIPKYQRVKKLTKLADYIRAYDGEVRFNDAAVGQLLHTLEALNLTEDTLIVLTADHGESLDEHNEFLQHGWFLYDTTIRVPLIFAFPERLAGGKRITGQVSNTDITPTILELLGIGSEADAFDGRSFAGEMLSGRLDEPRPAFAYGPRDNHPFAISLNGWKLIHSPAGRPDDPTIDDSEGPFKTKDRYELYNTATDPKELKNVAEVETATVEDLRKRLREFEKTFQPIRQR